MFESTETTYTLDKTKLENFLTEKLTEAGNFSPRLQTISFNWKYGSRLTGYSINEHNDPYFDGVSITVKDME